MEPPWDVSDYLLLNIKRKADCTGSGMFSGLLNKRENYQAHCNAQYFLKDCIPSQLNQSINKWFLGVMDASIYDSDLAWS